VDSAYRSSVRVGAFRNTPERFDVPLARAAAAHPGTDLAFTDVCPVILPSCSIAFARPFASVTTASGRKTRTLGGFVASSCSTASGIHESWGQPRSRRFSRVWRGVVSAHRRRIRRSARFSSSMRWSSANGSAGCTISSVRSVRCVCPSYWVAGALLGALQAKYPNAEREWGWQWVFPATRFYVDRVSGDRRRHHLHESVVQRAVKGVVPDCWYREAGDVSHAAAFVCDASARGGL
jgi:hypothetical protein